MLSFYQILICASIQLHQQTARAELKRPWSLSFRAKKTNDDLKTYDEKKGLSHIQLVVWYFMYALDPLCVSVLLKSFIWIGQEIFATARYK